MEAETAVQLNLGFESSRENIDQAKFASNRESNQNSFLGRRFDGSRGLFARNLFFRPDQLWKVILALAVLIFVLFASIAMLVHFAFAAAKVSPPLHDSDHHHHNHHHTTAQHLKLENKSEVVSPSPPPPPPPTPSPAPVIQERSEAAADVINSNSTLSTTTPPPPPHIIDHNETTTNMSTNATVVQQQPSIPWTPHCGTWAPYKDESCFHLFTGELWTWEEAAERCRGLGVGVTMLSIRDAPKQQFFREYIFGQQHKASFEDVWLGAQYRNASGDFRWADDGQAVVYGDWAPEQHFSTSTSLTTAEKHGNSRQGRSLLWFEQQQHSHSHEVDALYDVIEGKATLVGEEHVPAQPSSWLPPPPPLPPLPSHLITPRQKRQYTDQDCLHLTAYEARWEATPCAKRNLVLCEVLPLWSFAQFQRHFLDFRKEAERKVAAVIPVGFVYSQFDGQQPPPSALWPTMTWAELPGKTVQDARGNLVETIRFWKRIA